MRTFGLPDAARRELAPTGTLRLAVNTANAEMASERRPGEFVGKAIELSGRMAKDWKVAVEIVPFASGGTILDNMGAWDAAVLAVEASRLDRIHFSPAFATVDATLATVGTMPISTCRAADMQGVRIAVVRGAAYTAHLEREFRHCELVAFAAPMPARAAMLSGDCDFVAGIRSTLCSLANETPSVRVLDDDFLRIPQALAIPRDRSNARMALDDWFARLGNPDVAS